MYTNLNSYAATPMDKADLTLHKCIGQTLIHVGIFPNLKGHLILQDAILYRVKRGMYPQTGSDLYESLAHKYNTSVKGIEANIRSVLRAARASGLLKNINHIMGIEVADEYCHFSSLQFISLMSYHFMYTQTENDT